MYRIQLTSEKPYRMQDNKHRKQTKNAMSSHCAIIILMTVT